jgi:hypothetical protein
MKRSFVLYIVHYYADKIKMYYMGRSCSTYGTLAIILIRKYEIPLAKPRLIWEDNIKVDVKKIRYGRDSSV